MKVHYINILLFALPRNILVNTHKKLSITPPHIQTTRLLCECELFAPQNYDNDPEMKSVMQQFEDRTSQRFQEYDERLQEKRQICKDKCDKEIQKIILKDKLEKELTEKFATLQTDIHSDAIPTCICEKSIADKVEKTCLNCGKNLGGFVPGLGLIGGSALYVAAVKSSVELGIKMGMQSVISDLKVLWDLTSLIKAKVIENFVTPTNYCNITSIIEFLQNINKSSCAAKTKITPLFCSTVEYQGPEELAKRVAGIVEQAQFAGAQAANEKFLELTTSYAILSHPIVISLIVVVAIAVILLIIYLILRYRRKKKMKKKLQYMKLIKE
ncbi:rifin [Plasmodium falciparum NF54]|uniref:Rifin n=2 Tax=Plasmodium falciparum TaxID=5833 RepID=Q8I4P0_PLAF7|nr:rifin [Plasmodium falciparum 3D7]KAF4327295.1 rifin [Plasmodium falciparum NF54]PKC48324.1 rifin [Plasmodium falciparum NF54]CZT99700.1 rifin [Plasmodium falciparum 3D7]|eukprot:XP_001350930.1 rifin [Plasmodium falciparum 3D7]